MKKFLILAMALVMMLAAFAGCTQAPAADPTPAPEAPADPTPAPEAEAPAVMTYDEFVAAELETAVVVETYVQATQSWWDNKITAYTQDENGAYFLYEMACSEEDAAKLVPGTKIRVSGYKAEWAGEVEIIDATFEFLEGSYIAEPVDATEWLGTDELIAHQNQLASFYAMTVESIEFKNGEPGDDIYVTVSKDGTSYSFCVEMYLTGPDTDVYKTVSELAAGDIVDIEGFLYWYEGVNTHITGVTVLEKAPQDDPAVKGEGVMTYAEYAAAELDAPVVIEAYVQNTQSWWDNKITVYAQDLDGAYFLYELACSEEDAAKMIPGQKIRVTGYKTEWAGEVEIVDATFEFLDGSYVAEPVDATAWLGTDELIAHQNQLVTFTDMTVEAIEFKNGEPGDDIYVTVSKDGTNYSFCVELYLTGPDTEVYQTVSGLAAGTVVDIEGFLYWYEGVNTHITGITVK